MTDSELRDAAVAALRRTTVSYPEWQKRVAAGRYNPRDGSLTEWGKAFGYLSQIDGETTPPPVGPAPPVGPLTVRDGNRSVQSFSDAFVITGQPVTISRQHIKNVTGYGVGSQQAWPLPVSNPNPGRTTVTDCIAEGVAMPNPGSMGGTGEFPFWFGNPTTARRIVARNFAWGGINLVARSQGSELEDVLVEGGPVGLYVEHACEDSTVRRLFSRNIAPARVAGGNEPNGWLAARTVTHEWKYPGLYGNWSINGMVYEGGEWYCPPVRPDLFGDNDPTCAAYHGPGVQDITYKGVRFYGEGPAARAGRAWASTIRFIDCVFDQLGSRMLLHDLPVGV